MLQTRCFSFAKLEAILVLLVLLVVLVFIFLFRLRLLPRCLGLLPWRLRLLLRASSLFLPTVQRRMHVVHSLAGLLRRRVAVLALLLLLGRLYLLLRRLHLHLRALLLQLLL